MPCSLQRSKIISLRIPTTTTMLMILIWFYAFNFGVFLNAGLAVMILMGPLNAIVARKLKKYQLLQMKNKDQVQSYYNLAKKYST
jgi:hypothetical protein